MKDIVGQNIKRFRLMKGMRQEELCAGICSVSQLSKIENGKAQAKHAQLQGIAERLCMTVGELQTPDRVRSEVEKLIMQAKQAGYINEFDKLLLITQRIKQTSLENGYEDLYARGAFFEAQVHWRTKKYDLAISGFQDFFARAEDCTPSFQIKAYFFFGRSYFESGEYAKAMETFEKATQYIQAVPDDDPEAISANFFVGEMMSYFRDYRSMYFYASKSRRLALSKGERTWALRCRSAMAHSFLLSGRYEEAIPLYQANMKETEINTIVMDYGIASHNLACISLLTGKLGEARAGFESALQSFELVTGPYEHFLIEPFLELATVSVREGKLEESEVWLRKAEVLLRETPCESYLMYARVYRTRAEAAGNRRDVQEQHRLLQEALSLYDKHTVWYQAYVVATELADLFEALQQKDKALVMYRLAIEYNHKFEVACKGVDPHA